MKKYNYKKFEVEIKFNDYNDTFYGVAKHLSVIEHKTWLGAKKEIEEKIDSFLKIVPKTWDELAAIIKDSLVWHSHEDCEVDVECLKVILKNCNIKQFKN